MQTLRLTLFSFTNRENFPWDYRDADLNLLAVPPPSFDKNAVLSIHAAGDIKEQEQNKAAERYTRQWQERIVVDDTIFRTHRCLKETELRDRGIKASNQLAKLEGLLKNHPKKFSLSRAGLTLEEIPPLAVVANPSVDTPARKTGKLIPIARDQREEGNWGFYPGPFEKEGWLLEKNKMPISDQEHEKFRSLKGHDFRYLFLRIHLPSCYKFSVIHLQSDYERMPKTLAFELLGRPVYVKKGNTCMFFFSWESKKCSEHSDVL